MPLKGISSIQLKKEEKEKSIKRETPVKQHSGLTKQKNNSMLALTTKASPSPAKEKSPTIKHGRLKKPAATPLAN